VPYKVLIPQPVSKAGEQYLLDRGYEVKMGCGITVEILKEEVRDCHALLVRTASYPEEVLEAGTYLRVVGRHGVGVDNIDVDAATRLGIQVTNAPTSNTNSVAEHTIGLIIAVARNFLRSDQELRNGNFAIRNSLVGTDLEGKVLGLIGVGRIGRLVARKAIAGLDMKAIGFDPYIGAESVSGISMVDSIGELLRESDFVSLHLPANRETMGLIDMKKLEMMKTTAYLINAARGGIVVEDDLAAALTAGKLAGAALDVFAEEPPSPSNPLLELDNALLSPHNASLTRECMDRMALHAAQGIDEVLTGKPPTWPVNDPIHTK